jgi:hypothetical protein
LKLAVRAGLVDFVLPPPKDSARGSGGFDTSVAVVKKKPIWVTTGCKLRVGRIGWKSDFLLRGGVKLFPVDKLIRLDNKTYHIIAERKLKYGTIMLADKMISVVEVNFEHPLIIRQGYLVFDIMGSEAKLVDAEPTHVMAVFEHSIHFKRAEIKIIFKGNGGGVAFNDWVSCGRKSIAMAVAFVPFNSQFIVCFNDFYKYRCLDVLATIPPAVRNEFYTETPDLV